MGPCVRVCVFAGEVEVALQITRVVALGVVEDRRLCRIVSSSS
jgi:hypothetical protein